MSVTFLLEDFCNWPHYVVETTDISSAIVRRAYVNSVNFVPFDESPQDLLGMLVKWEHCHPYGTVTEHVAVCYNLNTPPWLQRLICAKEMIHILENGEAETSSREAFSALLDSLFPGDTERALIDIFRRQALHEHAAIFQATNLMFPMPHRERCREKLAKDEMSLAEVASHFDIPEFFAETLLSPEWASGEKRTLPLF